MRKPIIAGNWKMNKTRDEALQFIYAVKDHVASTDVVESVVCAPFPYLRCLVKRQGASLRVGAQNMHFESAGAYTGEVAPEMLTSIGVSYVVLGHSERREMFNETDETVTVTDEGDFFSFALPFTAKLSRLPASSDEITVTWLLNGNEQSAQEGNPFTLLITAKSNILSGNNTLIAKITYGSQIITRTQSFTLAE